MAEPAEAVNAIQTLCQVPAVEDPIKKAPDVQLMCRTEVSKLGQRC